MAYYWSIESIEKLISRYLDKGGEITTLEEGSLGYGTTLLHAPEEAKLKTIVIQEHFIGPWSSGNTVIKYNKMPKKYEKWLEKVLNSFEDEEDEL